MFKYAFDLVLRRKMRTFLTSLGITIAVFLISFIIFGMQDLKGLLVNQFSTQFKPDQVIVSRSSVSALTGGGSSATYDKKATETPVITQKVVDDIAAQPSIKVIQPYTIISGMDILLPEKKVPLENAITSAWDVKSSDSYFTTFTGAAQEIGNGEIFLNKRVADYYKMTPEEMIGKKYTFKVVGVYVAGQKQDDAIISTTTGISMLADLGGFKSSADYLNKIGYDMLYVTVNDTTKVNDLKSYVKNKYGYDSITSDDILSILNSITQGLTIALVMFASVSALVASIGIINTMIMSIYEQTREIGIIKAIGASNWQVLVIFLIQSGTIGLFGGVLGLGVIYLLMKATDGIIVKQLVGAGFNITQFFHFDIKIALAITFVSILVGVIAGIYPAIRASRLDPVKALRYE